MTCRVSQPLQSIAMLDVEGVLTPEVWIATADRTGIESLRRTTRDEPDYDELMKSRLVDLDRHGITMSLIADVIKGLKPLPGARQFLDELRAQTQVLLLSDTFEQFSQPLMRQLGWPALLCNTLVVEDDRIVDYRLRIPDQKAQAVRAFQSLNYRVAAVGDSYNDVSMLAAADFGVLFRAPDSVRAEHPQYPCCNNYEDLLVLLTPSDQ